ncbi:hypothetical protein V6N11_065967 [Hibiscus sabdariffa]|uniref:Uncharacterized protein n=2 Tax=Hibiscus sabdariffa TaxID=183260 RepID=A0ABR2AWF0_9ROSI
MDDYYRRSHVPAFGSWDWNNDLPFTQCFESARPAGLLRYTYSQDRDLYVAAGDLYENHVLTPAMIVVPRTRGRVRRSHIKQDKKERWEEAPNPAPMPMPRPTPKPVDEDLYKISPELLYAKTKKVPSTLH